MLTQQRTEPPSLACPAQCRQIVQLSPRGVDGHGTGRTHLAYDPNEH